MAALARAYDKVLMALAWLASAMLGAIFIVIVIDVTMRTMGLRSPVFTIAASEYALLFATTLAAPWLLHEKGHVVISTFVMTLPPRGRRRLERVMCLLGAVVCAVVAWYALQVLFKVEGYEIRSFEMPRWVVFVTMPICFAMLALEFLRLAVSGDSLHRGFKPEDEGL